MSQPVTDAGRKRKEDFAKKNKKNIQDKIDKILEGIMTPDKQKKLNKLRILRTKAENLILGSERGEGR